MASNIVFSDVESLIKVIRKLSEDSPDRVWVSGIAGRVNAKAPSIRTKNAVLTIEHHFDGEELFVGNSVSALTSGGGMFLLHVPSERINPKHLNDEECDEA